MSNITSFHLYKVNNNINYSAQQVLEDADKVFLIESTKTVSISDIVMINDCCYDIENNDYYVMIVLDKMTDNIILSYGKFSYCHSLYYFTSNEDIHVNISLHELLKELNEKPTLNIKSVREFVEYGFVIGEETLIEQIKKVPPLKTTIINNNVIKTIDSVYINRKGLNNYVDNLKLSLPTENTKIVLPLSGGYDSTLLAYLIKDYKEKIALSIGSLEDVKSTELPNSRKTAALLQIPRQEIHSDNSWIESFPKIVDIMEGEMFDIGVFLCYYLIDTIKCLNLTNYTVLTGDGSDQLLNKNYYVENIEKRPIFNRHNKFFPNKSPKLFFYYLIVKKIEWLLRLEGIDYVAPFISKEFIDFAEKTTFTEKKEEYKTFIRSYIPPEISSVLVKRGGLVQTRFFVNEDLLSLFLEILSIPKYKELFTDEDTSNDRWKTIYKMYIVFFNYIFIEKNSIDMDFLSILNELRKDKPFLLC